MAFFTEEKDYVHSQFLELFLFFFIHTNAAVLYINPQNSITLIAYKIFGKVAHIKIIESGLHILLIKRFCISAVFIVL